MSFSAKSMEWKRVSANFVSAGITWFAMSAMSFALADALPEATSVAVAAIVVGSLIFLLGRRVAFFKHRITLAVSGIGVFASLSKLPNEFGIGHVEGAALIVSVSGVLGLMTALMYFLFAD